MNAEILIGATGAIAGAVVVTLGTVFIGRKQIEQTAAQAEQTRELQQLQAKETRALQRDQAEETRALQQAQAEENRRLQQEQFAAALAQQREEAAEARKAAQLDARRDAFVVYMASVETFRTTCHELASELGMEAPVRERYAAVHDRYIDAWRQMARECSNAIFHAPANFEKVPDELLNAQAALKDVCRDWYIAITERGSANRRWDKFWAANRTALDAYYEFARGAKQAVVSPDAREV
ncbi:hypothetical protein [Streptomyces sp. WMMB 322]|uniref:hypothetical protein n=1 Tax=Streptomyces sp. WMMB 322 TaxID=1286821 RepID=UPI00082396F4|nr:hypothetical protein [Streptomyces sp. WMMB 322]SCK09652.1 hypothetical protein H180DRAFT_00485 [Streptomyces sp. WMMB 322]